METNAITAIANAFTQGGVWMYAILIIQIFSIAIIIERCIALYMKRNTSQKSLVRSVEEDIKKGNLDRALQKSISMGRTQPIGAVLQAGIMAAQNQGGREEIQAKMDEVLVVENARMEKRTPFLAMLGNVGTLLGLLGTIVGLIQAFSSAANLNAVEKSQLLTQGVSLAMNTTAYGLIMAIPALIMYAVLMNKTNSLQEDLNQAAFKAFNWLSFNVETIPSKTGRASRSN